VFVKIKPAGKSAFKTFEYGAAGRNRSQNNQREARRVEALDINQGINKKIQTVRPQDIASEEPMGLNRRQIDVTGRKNLFGESHEAVA